MRRGSKGTRTRATSSAPKSRSSSGCTNDFTASDRWARLRRHNKFRHPRAHRGRALRRPEPTPPSHGAARALRRPRFVHLGRHRVGLSFIAIAVVARGWAWATGHLFWVLEEFLALHRPTAIDVLSGALLFEFGIRLLGFPVTNPEVSAVLLRAPLRSLGLENRGRFHVCWFVMGRFGTCAGARTRRGCRPPRRWSASCDPSAASSTPSSS
jgi:hypothetical protein